VSKKLKTKKELIRLDGKLREVLTVRNHEGKILHKIISPIMVEFKLKDVLQIMIGAAILAVPVGFTEETWVLGEILPLKNILGFLILSLVFIATFVYYNYYRDKMKKHKWEFIKRVLLTYSLSFFVVGVVLYLIKKAPWSINSTLAFKRTVIVTFPASMSAAVADMIK
jgi:uncharacterized membrane protein